MGWFGPRQYLDSSLGEVIGDKLRAPWVDVAA
jgi:hypothetical protein